jgi:bifunctional enzyme CysN/CysC
MMIDGDHVRHGLNGDLGFSPADRTENIRRVSEVARLFFEQGSITLCSFVSPYREDRDLARHLIPEGRFVEVHVDCDIEVCKKRDPKGLYERAEKGEISSFTGVSAPYEAPERPELVLRTDRQTVEECVDELMELLVEYGILSGS